MKVAALKLGFFNNRRVREGDVIEVEEDQFSEVWMKKVDEDKKVTEKEAVNPEFHTVSEGSKAIHTGSQEVARGTNKVKESKKPTGEKVVI